MKKNYMELVFPFNLKLFDQSQFLGAQVNSYSSLLGFYTTNSGTLTKSYNLKPTLSKAFTVHNWGLDRLGEELMSWGDVHSLGFSF